MWRATFGLLWWITSDVHSTAGNRQGRREVGYHARLGEGEEEAPLGEKELVCELTEVNSRGWVVAVRLLMSSTISGLVAGTKLAPRTQQESDQRLLQRLGDTEAHIGPQSTSKRPAWRIRDEPLRCSLLGRSLEGKLSSAFHQLLGEIAVMQSQELPVLVHVSSLDGLTTSAPLILVAWRSVAVQIQVL